MTGAYTAYRTEISKEEMNVFNTAIKGIVGVKYTPLTVSTQVVSGINYRFFCNAIGIYPNALNEGAIVEIYQPSNGIPHITSIRRCN